MIILQRRMASFLSVFVLVLIYKVAQSEADDRDIKAWIVTHSVSK